MVFMYYFASDYMEGAHPLILKKLEEINTEKISGYGSDHICACAAEKIKEECECAKAEVHFLVGGTQTNAAVIGSALRPFEGVIAAHTGHIATHEAGAIEHGGHKVITLEGENGKLKAEKIDKYMTDFTNDGNNTHMVMPKMVYISHPTEYGTLYGREELENIRKVCDKFGLILYLDGARMAYALGAETDVALKEIAENCHIFYIGGTKCGGFFRRSRCAYRAFSYTEFFYAYKNARCAFGERVAFGNAV